MPPRTIVLPVKCSTAKKIANASVVIVSGLIWIAWGCMFKIWLDISPTSAKSIDGFFSIIMFLFIALAYTVFCAIPKLPKFTCIKDDTEEP